MCFGATMAAHTPLLAAPMTCLSAAAENIYPGEVESLLERHDDIVQACVVPVPDEIEGNA